VIYIPLNVAEQHTLPSKYNSLLDRTYTTTIKTNIINRNYPR